MQLTLTPFIISCSMSEDVAQGYVANGDKHI